MKLIDWLSFVLICSAANGLLICLFHAMPPGDEKIAFSVWAAQDHEFIWIFLGCADVIAFTIFLRAAVELGRKK